MCTGSGLEGLLPAKALQPPCQAWGSHLDGCNPQQVTCKQNASGNHKSKLCKGKTKLFNSSNMEACSHIAVQELHAR